MTAHSGGKFSDKTYRSVIGMNGIGGKGVALSSKYFKVQSIRDNKKATLEIEKGIKKNFKVEKMITKNKGKINIQRGERRAARELRRTIPSRKRKEQ